MVQSKTPLPVWLCSKPLLVSASIILSLFNMLKLLSSCELYCFISPNVSAFDYADLKFIFKQISSLFWSHFFLFVFVMSQITIFFFFCRGVGFLRYFQLKQLPNFLLASPILVLSICSIVQYMKLRPEVVFSLGFGASHAEKEAASILYCTHTDRNLDNASISNKHDLSENAKGIPFSFSWQFLLFKC